MPEESSPERATRTVVIDFDMPFLSIANFMLKWAVASIPAFVLLGVALFVIGSILAFLFTAFMAGLTA